MVKSKPQPYIHEVKEVLTKRELQRQLGLSKEDIEDFLRRKVLRAWVYFEPFEDYFPLNHAATIAVIESRGPKAVTGVPFEFNKAENAAIKSGKVAFERLVIGGNSIRFSKDEVLKLGSKSLTFSRDFARITYKGRNYVLNETQAEIVRIMWVSHLRGEEEILEAKIYEALGKSIKDQRLENSFKNSTLLGTLIVQTLKRRRAYRLDV